MRTLKTKSIQVIFSLIGLFMINIQILSAKTDHSVLENNIILFNIPPCDGIRIIDTLNKTITIKAVYFVRGEKVIKSIHSQSGKVKYYPNTGYTKQEVDKLGEEINSLLNEKKQVVTEGTFQGYQLIFNLDFVWVGSTQEARIKAINEIHQGHPIGNTFEIGNPTHHFFIPRKLKDRYGNTIVHFTGGLTHEQKYILMNPEKNTILNQTHEIFHTLGMGHKNNRGIMSYPPRLPNQEDINCVASEDFLSLVQWIGEETLSTIEK